MTLKRIITFLRPAEWSFWLLYVIIFLIPLNKRVIPGLIFFLVATAIIHWRFKIEPRLRPMLLLLGIYFLHAIGLSYSEHLVPGKKELEFKASFLAFPLIAFMFPRFTFDRTRLLLNLFIWGSILFVLIALGYGLHRSLKYDDFDYLGYGKLGIYFHPTYAAVYQVFTLTILLLRGFKNDFFLNNKIVHYTICSLLVIFISMLASKAGILSAIVMIIFCGIPEWKVNRKKILLPVLLLVILSVASALMIPKSGERISGAIDGVRKDLSGTKEEAHHSVDLREVAWRGSVQLISENPFGVGTGDATPELVKIYSGMNENYAAKKNLNSHNQFLQITCELGWPGLLLLVSFLLWIFVIAWKNREWLFMAFIITCSLNFLFESFLEVQAGLVFFCIWVMIFLKKD